MGCVGAIVFPFVFGLGFGRTAGRHAVDFCSDRQMNANAKHLSFGSMFVGNAPTSAADTKQSVEASKTTEATTTEAMAIRAQWMRQMGLGEDEIAEYCNEARYAANTADEQKELEAMARLIASEQDLRTR